MNWQAIGAVGEVAGALVGVTPGPDQPVAVRGEEFNNLIPVSTKSGELHSSSQRCSVM